MKLQNEILTVPLCLVGLALYSPIIILLNKCTMYGVECTMYGVECTLYGVECTLYGVQCTLYGVQCTLYGVQCTLYCVQCTYSAQCLTVQYPV